MAPPVERRDRHARVSSGARPPKWSVAVLGSRVRLSLGMTVCLAAAAATAAARPSSLLAWALLGGTLSVIVSTLVHEAAHAWAAHNLGYHVEYVVLGALAGVTAYFGRDDRPLERAAVALAGPAASAGLVLALVGVRTTLAPGSTALLAVEAMIALNALALVANLLPFGGTDGAHLVRGLFQHRRGPHRAPSGPAPPLEPGPGTAPERPGVHRAEMPRSGVPQADLPRSGVPQAEMPG